MKKTQSSKYMLNSSVLTPVFALSILILLLNISACGSTRNSDRDKVVQRTTNNVHIYNDGEYIQYNITGTVTTTFMSRDSAGRVNQETNPNQAPICFPKFQQTESPVTGVLNISWYANAPLTKPLLSGGTYDVMRQESTLSLDSVGTYVTNEYISQDAGTGAITIRAYENVPMSTYYWATTSTVLDSINSPLYLQSPIPEFDTVYTSYFLNAGCDATSSCTQTIRQITHNQTFNGEFTSGLQTDLGLFNPLSIQFTDVYEDNNDTNVSAKLDVKGFCNDPVFFVYGVPSPEATYRASPKTESFIDGSAWIMPETGILQLEFACSSNQFTILDLANTSQVNPPVDGCTIPVSDSTGQFIETTTYNLTAKISATNIALPQ